MSEATRNICHVLGWDVINITTAYCWFERFRNGDESLIDEPWPNSPNLIDLSVLKQALEREPSLSTGNLASTLGSTQHTIKFYIKRLGFVSKLSGWCPHDFYQKQLQKCVNVCKHLSSSHRIFNWLDNLITGDEKWVHYVNDVPKRHWVQPHQKPELTPKGDKHPKKRILSIWFCVNGVLY